MSWLLGGAGVAMTDDRRQTNVRSEKAIDRKGLRIFLEGMVLVCAEEVADVGKMREWKESFVT